ncbi:MAG: STAS domain-containing protein [Nitrospirae bacterium]|nr:STAS domain-containing protein [Nitrospirota bacterium]
MKTDAMEIEVLSYRGIDVLKVYGDIDLYSSPGLRKNLISIICKKPGTLLVDLSNVSYIDSSGIATFVEGLKNMMCYGGRLKFIGLPDRIREIFSFSRLDKVFEIYDGIDQAI